MFKCFLVSGLGLLATLAPARANPSEDLYRQPSLRLWVRASDIEGTQGQRVDHWKDRSSLQNDLNQSTVGRQPTLRETSINGQPALSFRGDYFTTSKPIFQRVADFSVFAVIQKTATSAALEFFFAAGKNSQEHCLGFFQSKISLYCRSGIRPAIVRSSKQVGRNQPSIVEYHKWVLDLEVFANGKSFGKTEFKVPSAPLNEGPQSIGGSPAGRYFLGEIAELVFYEEVLSPAQRTAIRCDLASRYSIPTQGCRTLGR